MSISFNIPLVTTEYTGNYLVPQGNYYSEYRYSSTKISSPNSGEYWYVKLPLASALSKFYVKSQSAHTVLLTKSKNSHVSEGVRYITTDITWVEQCEDEDNS